MATDGGNIFGANLQRWKRRFLTKFLRNDLINRLSGENLMSFYPVGTTPFRYMALLIKCPVTVIAARFNPETTVT